MMGIMPDQLYVMFEGLAVPPLAMGANCGVGASDILVSLLAMTGSNSASKFIVKGNCGIPQFHGTEIHYTGTPELMAVYAALAVHSGARIVGGCCGTSPEHLAAMRKALDATLFDAAQRPTIESLVEAIGPLANQAPTLHAAAERPRRRGRSTTE